MTASVHAFTTNVLDWALLPFAAGLALSLYTVAAALELPYAPIIGASAGTLAAVVWLWLVPGRPEAGRKAEGAG